MKVKLLTSAALIASIAVTVSAALSSKTAADTKITGDYVEARTAAVFAGACHYNGELVTTGRDAVLAWNFTGGTFRGVDLNGVRAVAAVNAKDTLGDPQAPRKWELVIDSAASTRQAEAAQALIQSKAAAQLGQLTTVRRAPISFTHGSSGYTVDAEGFAQLVVQHMTDDTCCTSPNMVWFEPLSPVQGRKVGFSELTRYSGSISDPWQRVGENNAFYGPIAF